MSSWTTEWAFAIGCVVALDVGRRYLKATKSRSSHPLPPGPPGIPFFGNVIGVNPSAPWVTYSEWAKSYGDLIYTRLLGREIIIINSEKVAKDLLEDRSWNYSDRPWMATNELCGVDFSTAFMPYGDRWRAHRRFFQQTFRSGAASRFVPLQHRKACQFLRRLLQNPAGLSEHVFEYTTSVVLGSVYDYDTTDSQQDELVDIAAKVIDIIVPALRPDTAFIVGAFPALLYLPSWFPGMSFMRDMAIAKEFSKEYVERPFAYTTKERIATGSSVSMVDDALRKIEEKGVSADETWTKALKESAATAFLGASETSNSVLMTFFLAMVVAPEAQEKAQAEIDAVVGRNRLPSIEDRPSLPYVEAVLREALRYGPTLPLLIPHAAVDDDIYAGYYIPKGAVILANAWAMAHNEAKYPDSHRYIPERFLNEDGSLKAADIQNIVFGVGRRFCVGKHFADSLVWTLIAKFLAVFKILRPIDENGVEIPVEPRFSSGFAVHPLPFGFRIVPRISGMDASKLDELIAGSTE